MSPDGKSRGKILPLEALRGMAAICVVMQHFFLAFLPEYLGMASNKNSPHAIAGTPFFFFFNGKAMVAIFFIMSGYVLARKGLQPDAQDIIADAAIKRWFRFVFPIFFSLLFSWELYELHCYHYEEVYALNKSWWFHPGVFLLPEQYRPGFFQIVYESFFGSLFFGENYFNGVLWSMSWEFYGSMIVFLFALLFVPQKRWWFNIFFPLIAIALVSSPKFCWLSLFLVGFMAAAVRLENILLSKPVTVALLASGFYFCGYYYSEGWYAWASSIPLQQQHLQIIAFIIGGTCVIAAFITKNSFSQHFNGGVSVFLGEISFPLYLLNMPVILTFCAWSYVVLKGGMCGVFAAAATLALVLPPIAWALKIADGLWIRCLARWRPLGRILPT